jgi:undecaprenyl diphosphate synthase
MDALHIAIYPDFVNNCTDGIPAFIEALIDKQIAVGLPVLTINVLPLFGSKPDKLLDQLLQLFSKLSHSKKINEHQMKISVLGKWYDLPEEVVEAIKSAVISTKDYDGMFLNLCINYDGQDDIVEACKMVTRKVLTGKLNVDQITADLVKENVYSSFFLPPEKMILLDGKRTPDGFLLWDTAKTHIIYKDMPWNAWDIKELEE